jgi:hypothetical protein
MPGTVVSRGKAQWGPLACNRNEPGASGPTPAPFLHLGSNVGGGKTDEGGQFVRRSGRSSAPPWVMPLPHAGRESRRGANRAQCLILPQRNPLFHSGFALHRARRPGRARPEDPPAGGPSCDRPASGVAARLNAPGPGRRGPRSPGPTPSGWHPTPGSTVPGGARSDSRFRSTHGWGARAPVFRSPASRAPACASRHDARAERRKINCESRASRTSHVAQVTRTRARPRMW